MGIGFGILLHGVCMCLSFWVAFGKFWRPIGRPVFWINLFAAGFNFVGLVHNLLRLV